MITTGYALRAIAQQASSLSWEERQLLIADDDGMIDRRELYSEVARSAPVDPLLMAQFEGEVQAEMDDLEMRVEGIQP